MSTFVDIGYRLTRHLDDDAFAAALTGLSADERARCAQFRFAQDRWDFAAAHMLLREALSAHVQRDPGEWVFTSDQNGKPRAAASIKDWPRLEFNLSHTRGLVACVVARGMEVGIDVEPVDDGTEIMEVARSHFSSSEVIELERSAGARRAARFTELWTLKEAYVKATGAGILHGLDECIFEFESAGSLRFQSAQAAQADDWTFALFQVLDYRLAVAVRDPARSLRTVRVRAVDGDDKRGGGAARLLRASMNIAMIS